MEEIGLAVPEKVVDFALLSVQFDDFTHLCAIM